jgi:hypothetical protein
MGISGRGGSRTAPTSPHHGAASQQLLDLRHQLADALSLLQNVIRQPFTL